MSDSLPQGTQGSHGEPLLPQAAEWDTAGTDGAGGFLDPSSFTPADYATQGFGPAAALTGSPIDLAAVSVGPIPPASNLSCHHQLPPQTYFAVADNSSIDAYPYYQHQHDCGGSFAPGNAVADVPVAHGYGQDAWMGGINHGSIDAVASGAGVMPAQSSSSSSSSSSQSFQPMAMSQYHAPPAADGLGYESSPLSTPGSHMMQSPWSPQWDSVQGPVMAGDGGATAVSIMATTSPTATGQSVVSDGTLMSAMPVGADRQGKGVVVVDALGGGPSASSTSSSSAAAAAAALNPVAQHASNTHGSPADHHASPGGRRGDRRSSRSIAPGPSGHPRTPHRGYQQQQHQQVYGYPGGHPAAPTPAAAPGSAAMSAYSPDSHAMGDVVQSPPPMGLTQGSGSVVAPGCSAQQHHVASPHHGAAPPQAAGGHHHYHALTPSSSSSSSPTTGIEIDYPTGTDLKREDLRRRNRMAANKCRAKAKEGEIRLQSNAWVASGSWTDLSAKAGKLTMQVRALRKEVQRHAHCGHELIQEYLRHTEPLTESDDEGDGASDGVIARQATL